MRSASVEARPVHYAIGSILFALVLYGFYVQVGLPLRTMMRVNLVQTTFSTMGLLLIALVQLKRARVAALQDSPLHGFLRWVFWCLVGLCGITICWVKLAVTLLARQQP
jgi:cytochrome b561